jgi:hypothetical protein
MPILNYTTKVPANQTVSEIHAILSRVGAREVSTEYDKGEVSAIRFVMTHADQPLSFRIEARPAGVLKSMARDKAPNRTPKQAQKVAWRILKNAIEAQMAIYESQQGDVAEIFLPYAIDNNGKSFYAVFTEVRVKALKG